MIHWLLYVDLQVVRVLTPIRCLAFAISLSSLVYSQSDVSQRASIPPSSTLKALEQVQRDYTDFLAKREKLEEKYGELETQLKKSEEDLQRINVEGLRQQMLAMQSRMQSMQINMALRTQSGALGSTNSNPAALDPRMIAQQQLLQNRFMQDLNTTLRGEELRQLDATSQQVVRRRIEAIQASVKLQQEWGAWQSEWPRFMERYWPHSDPERRFTPGEVDAALEILEKSDDSDYAAKITEALLMDRAGRWSEGLERVEQVLKAESSLQGVALMTKALLMTSLKKDKEAKQSLQAAVKVDKANPYVRWIRARIAASQEQWSIAESEWKFLTTIKPLEKEARRSLALIHYARSEKSSGEGSKALKEAQTAMELETVPTWFSHFVLGLSLNAARKSSEAQEELARAEEKADDSQKEWIQKVRSAIEAGEFYELNFLTGFGGSSAP